MSQPQSQSAARRYLVEDLGPAQCPRCRHRVDFVTDLNGYAMEQCDCGYSAYISVRVAAASSVSAVRPVVAPFFPAPLSVR